MRKTEEAAEHGIAPIDLVWLNLYPFEATAAKAGYREELIETLISAGAMLPVAAKKISRAGRWSPILRIRAA